MLCVGQRAETSDDPQTPVLRTVACPLPSAPCPLAPASAPCPLPSARCPLPPGLWRCSRAGPPDDRARHEAAWRCV